MNKRLMQGLTVLAIVLAVVFALMGEWLGVAIFAVGAVPLARLSWLWSQPSRSSFRAE